MAKVPAIWVKWHDPNWRVTREGSQVALYVTTKKQEAVDAARSTAKKDGAELIVCRMDGTIEFRDSHGHDPRNVPG